MSKYKYIILALLISQLTGVYASTTLREKIGQMIMVGFYGTEIPDSLKYDIEFRNLGGVVTLAYNLESPTQIKALTDSLQDMAATELFISVDQEGGYVARLDEQNGYQATTSAYQLGTVFNTEVTTRNQARKMAGWIEPSGLNLNLAPVVDVNVNPTSPAIGHLNRSFSSDPMTVYNHASWFIDEFHESNLITALKHFPGHGSAQDDSHLGFTNVTDTWTANELIPYQQLIGSGYSDMIMTGHLFNARLDSLHPATLSRLTIHDLLRDSLGYDGVVISDAMYMQAIKNNYTFEEAIELAINASVDILLYTSYMRDDVSLAGTIIDVVEDKVNQGLISEETIDAAYGRIMNLKSRLIPGVAVTPAAPQTPNEFLLRAFPNPFNASTTISILLPQRTELELELLTIQGRLVSTIESGIYEAGQYYFQIDGSQLASGVYLVRQSTSTHSTTAKISLIK